MHARRETSCYLSSHLGAFYADFDLKLTSLMSFYDTGEPWARNGTESNRLYTESSINMQCASTDDDLQILLLDSPL